MNIVEPNYKVPSGPTVTAECRNSLKRKLSESLCSRHVAFTTDLWTSRAYIIFTAHWLNDDWKMECKEFPERHTSDNIADCLRQACIDWKISDEFVTAIVHDNASCGEIEMGKLTLCGSYSSAVSEPWISKLIDLLL